MTVAQASGLGLGAIVAVALIGLLIAVLVSRLVVRVIVAVVVVALAVVIWMQRTAVIDAAQDAAQRCNATFFGVHLSPSNPSVRHACQAVTRR